jgi:hypothetical protein
MANLITRMAGLGITPDPTARANHPSLAPSPQVMTMTAAYELALLIELGGTAMKAELCDWLIDNDPAIALQGIRELKRRIGA